MEVNCKNCGLPCIPREVKKGPRGPWTAYECHGGCTNDKGYKLTTSPPRQSTGNEFPKGNFKPTVNNTEKQLDQIINLLTEIHKMMVLRNDPLEKQV